MAKVRGSTLVGRALKNERVKTIFTLSGELSEIYDACIDESIKFIDMRHEQAVANAATGYAMATGEPGVCMGTAGPGAINLAATLLRGEGCSPGIRLQGCVSPHHQVVGFPQLHNEAARVCSHSLQIRHYRSQGPCAIGYTL
jgi:acetolactate synthase-1/2/3 large subunit